jgi:ATP adenylyltransferase/5',5'''-P-1,P-4-tetraphosphate phosphorylase II
VPKFFERQETPLKLEDMEAMLITMQSNNAFCFWNRGLKSGMSVPHKHFQSIPYKAMENGKLPIEESFLKQDLSRNDLF